MIHLVRILSGLEKVKFYADYFLVQLPLTNLIHHCSPVGGGDQPRGRGLPVWCVSLDVVV